MTKREYRYHLLRKLFKPCTIPFCGTIGSPVYDFLTTADLEKIIAELKASKPTLINGKYDFESPTLDGFELKRCDPIILWCVGTQPLQYIITKEA